MRLISDMPSAKAKGLKPRNYFPPIGSMGCEELIQTRVFRELSDSIKKRIGNVDIYRIGFQEVNFSY